MVEEVHEIDGEGKRKGRKTRIWRGENDSQIILLSN